MSLDRAYRHVQLEATKTIFDDLIDTHAKAYLSAYPEIKEFSDYGMSGTLKYYIGMIWTSDFEKPDLQQLRIRGSRALAQNKIIELDLSAITSEHTFFPGQILAFQAELSLRRQLAVKKFFDPIKIAPPLKPSDSEAEERRILFVASGPYMSIDKEDWTLFDKLVENIKSSKATHVILMGPFVDIENKYIKAQYDVTWKLIFDKLIEGLYDCECHIYLVPSNRDILPNYLETNYFYPMEEFNFKHVLKPDVKPKCKIEPVKDPAQIDLGGIYVDVTSAEVVSHFNQCISSINRKKPKIFELISEHLITHGIYPIYPSAKDIAIDYTKLYEYLRIDRLGSHIVIVPSRNDTSVIKLEDRHVVLINRFSTKKVAVLMELPEFTNKVLEIR